MKDYYDILGVPHDATPEQIRQAFYKLAHRYHPDKGGDPEKFKEINEAYRVLSDPEKRAQYDKFGTVFGGVGAETKGGPQWQSFDWDIPFGFSSDFSSFSGLEDIFADFFNSGTKRTKRREQRGKNLEIDLEISLEEAAFGVKKEVSFKTYVVCPHCHGKGYEPHSKMKTCPKCKGEGVIRTVKRTFWGTFTQIVECPKCHGRGKIPEKPCRVCGGDGRYYDRKSITVDIPAGVRDGEVIRIKGEGEAGILGAPNGDLFIKIRVKPHPVFERKGDDLFTTITISFPEAALGTKKEIKTLEGKTIVIKIPPGTDSGEIFRVRNKGIKHFNAPGAGDLYIKVKVKTPKSLSRKAKELLNELQQEIK